MSIGYREKMERNKERMFSMNEMQIFQYENNKIRTILKDGEPW